MSLTDIARATVTTQNPHVWRVHIPAHLVGVLGVMTTLSLLIQHPHLWASVIAALMIFNFWFSCLGISVGFHRYFTHKAFTTNRWWERLMLWGGVLAGQGSPIFWAALHRQHHHRTDVEGDPHSPKVKADGSPAGLWHAYMGWILELDPRSIPLYRAQDLVRNPEIKWIHRNYHRILWAWWIVVIACMMLGTPVLQALGIGAALAGTWSIHQEAWINSFCHDPRFGYANQVLPPRTVSGEARDIPWMRFVTWGQSLHSTHHLDPRAADFGWYLQPMSGAVFGDPGYAVVKLISTNKGNPL